MPGWMQDWRWKPRHGARSERGVEIPARGAKVVPAVAVAAVTVPHAPLVIAQAQQNTTPDDAASAGRLARDPNSLLAKTLDLKDHVVAATRHVRRVIGDMFASVGERNHRPAVSGAQFSSDVVKTPARRGGEGAAMTGDGRECGSTVHNGPLPAPSGRTLAPFGHVLMPFGKQPRFSHIPRLPGPIVVGKPRLPHLGNRRRGKGFC